MHRMVSLTVYLLGLVSSVNLQWRGETDSRNMGKEPDWRRMEKERHGRTNGWSTIHRSSPTRNIELTFALKQRNVDELENALMRVSYPNSSDYGKHLSNSQVHELVAPDPEHVSIVLGFLRDHDAEVRWASPNRDMLASIVSIETAEKMLNTEYHELVHNETGARLHRTPGGYKLPSHVAAAVDFVSPTIHMHTFAVHDKLEAHDSKNTPENLRKLYSINDVVGLAGTGKQAVTSFLGELYAQNDLEEYWTAYCDSKGLLCGNGLPELVGDATVGSPGVESMLDIETMTGVGGNISTEFWGFAGVSKDNIVNEPFMKWLMLVASTDDADVPKIFSTSYGEDEDSWSYSAIERINVEFMKAGVRGITLIFASGDEGANCVDGVFTPETPASSPYVTAVGGTMPGVGYPEPGSEKAVYFSSGGFSNYWGMPQYQKDVVEKYLLGNDSLGHNVATGGRAFPDIAAQGIYFCVVPYGCGIAGTSCSAPTVGGIIGLLNDLRYQNGKTSLGFLNPFLYQRAFKEGALFDVTEGESTGCNGGSGWQASVGWDAVTGLGTPNYMKLAELVLKLP